MENIIKASSKNKAAQVTFYVFEICALVLAAYSCIMGLVYAIEGRSFMTFVNGLMQAVYEFLIIYGLGRIIDLLAAKKESKTEKQDK